MKLIGIIGKSGSGKTTLARMLQRNEKTVIIHLDRVTSTNAFTKRIPKTMAHNYTNNIGENGIILSSDIMKFIYKIKNNKILDIIYLNILKLPRDVNIKKQIKKCEEEGKSCVIIERCYVGISFVV
jgi:adenylate kinase family enzyme